MWVKSKRGREGTGGEHSFKEVWHDRRLGACPPPSPPLQCGNTEQCANGRDP